LGCGDGIFYERWDLVKQAAAVTKSPDRFITVRCQPVAALALFLASLQNCHRNALCITTQRHLSEPFTQLLATTAIRGSLQWPASLG
jgi:hypothetical protein